MSKTAKNGSGPAAPRRPGRGAKAAKKAARKAPARRAKPEPSTEELLLKAWEYTYRNRDKFAN